MRTVVSKYASLQPHTIGRDQTLAAAHHMMRSHHIRHLPVLHGGQLVGILTDRDLHLIESLSDVDPQSVLVDDAMSQAVYTVSPQAPLEEVVREMAEHKFGSAVLMDHGKVVGIFTTIDALRALAETLSSQAQA